MEEIKKEKSWWSRNWKWVVPTGGCLFFIIAIILFAGTLFVGVTSLFTNSDAYNESLKRVVENQEIIAILGEPIETNGMSGGNINNSNGFKTAALTIPIKGPKGEASIRVEGEGVGDTWTYQTMSVYVDGSDTVIDLLAAEKKLID